MSVQVQHRRGTASAGASFIGAEGEIGYLTDQKRLVAHDGATPGGIPMARLDEVTDEVMRPVGNADFSFQVTDRLVVPNAVFSAPRTGTLPLANSVAAGRTITFFDALPAVNGANVVTVVRSGSDTINGANSYVCLQPRGRWDFVSDGTSKWSVAQEKQPLDATLTALAGVTTAANKLIYATGADAFSTTDLTAWARARLADADAAAAQGALAVGAILISKVTVSSPVAAIDMTLPSGFSRFILRVSNLRTAVDAALALRVSTDNGATYIATSSYAAQSLAANASTVTAAAATGTLFNISPTYDADVTTNSVNSVVEIPQYLSGVRPLLLSEAAARNPTDIVRVVSSCEINVAAALTNIRLLASTVSNIASGTITLTGER